MTNTTDFFLITPTQCVETLERLAVAECVKQGTPDHKYVMVKKPSKFSESGFRDTCVYAWDGQPSCIVGRYLVDIGVATVEDLETYDAHDDGAFDEIHADFELPLAQDVAEILLDVQRRQDEGTPWLQAISETKKRANLV